MRPAFFVLQPIPRCVTLLSCSTTTSNRTVIIDEETLKKARLRALQQGTSINELLRRFLESYGVSVERTVALEDLLALSRNGKSRESGVKRWSREELYPFRALGV
jgi:hypothetical protein